MTLDHSCPACGQSLEMPLCPTCSDGTQDPAVAQELDVPNVQTLNSVEVPDTLGDQVEQPIEVIYVMGSFDSQLSRRDRYLQRSVRALIIYAMPVLCATLAVVGRFRIVFIIGAILGLQAAFLRMRSQSFQGPTIDDEIVRSRINPPLKELCASAGCEVPRVCVRRSIFPAAMFRQKSHSTLWLSPDFLDVTDDAALRAIIAHEIVHLRRNDAAATKRLDGRIFFAMYAVWLILLFRFPNDLWLLVVAFFAFIVPVNRITAIMTGSWRRDRETRADLEGAELANDPDAMIRGLRDVYGLIPGVRRNIYGPTALRWMLFPYCTPPTVHPSLEKRVAKLEAMARSTADIDLFSKDLVDRDVFRLRVVSSIGVAAFVVALFFLLHHNTPKTEAHFIPLSEMGFPSFNYQLSPLSPREISKASTTATAALSTAESREELQPGPGLYDQMSEGNFTDATKNIKNEPAYVVVLSGPVLNNSFFYGGLSQIVVVVSAEYGTIIDSTEINDS